MHTSAKFERPRAKNCGMKNCMFCNNPIYERPLGIFVTTKQIIDNAQSISLVNNVFLVLSQDDFFCKCHCG